MVESFYRNLNIIMDKHTIIQEYIVNCVSIEKLKEFLHPLTQWIAIFLQCKLNTFPRNVLTEHFSRPFLLCLLTCNYRDFSLLLGMAVLLSTAQCSPVLPKQWICLQHWVQATGIWQDRVFCSRCSGKFGLVKISLDSFVLFKGLIHLLYFKLSPKWVFRATFCFALAQFLC